ncbi:hypothetical protein [Maribacter sp. 2308TA10-17]|uniref:hypothetical protein n=1 Tax=Maribacter sp. 2308TA10-17 TaxID=3386276 RepID=UPI0039BCF563
MRHLIFVITFFSFLAVYNLEAQTKTSSVKKNQTEKIKNFKFKEYYPLSDKQYESISNLKGKKEITLENGEIAYMITAQQIELVTSISPEVLEALNAYYCSLPLEPGDLCEGDCRRCPEGYFCGRILRPAQRPCLETQRDERGCEDVFIVQPGPKRCIALPTGIRLD